MTRHIGHISLDRGGDVLAFLRRSPCRQVAPSVGAALRRRPLASVHGDDDWANLVGAIASILAAFRYGYHALGFTYIAGNVLYNLNGNQRRQSSRQDAGVLRRPAAS
jgi:hypothetical protein